SRYGLASAAVLALVTAAPYLWRARRARAMTRRDSWRGGARDSDIAPTDPAGPPQRRPSPRAALLYQIYLPLGVHGEWAVRDGRLPGCPRRNGPDTTVVRPWIQGRSINTGIRGRNHRIWITGEIVGLSVIEQLLLDGIENRLAATDPELIGSF